MPPTVDTAPGWLQIALGVVASFVGGGAFLKLGNKLYKIWVNRLTKLPAAEVHVTEETATEIRVRSEASASESIMSMMRGLAIAQLNIDKRIAERDEARERADAAEEVAAQAYNEVTAWKFRAGQLEIELRHHRDEIARLHALLVLHKIAYSEADKIRMEQLEGGARAGVTG
jgi:hypothetical protein